MRMDQLVLLGRVGVCLAGAALVAAAGVFRTAYAERHAAASVVDWPASTPTEIARDWPPAFHSLSDIWTPYVGGVVPVRDDDGGDRPDEPTPTERFLRDTTFLGACDLISSPLDTSVALQRPDGEHVLSVGETVDLWRLLEVEYLQDTWQFRLHFRHVRSGDEATVETPARTRDWERVGRPFPRVEDSPMLDIVPRHTLPRDAQAYYVPTRREWFVPRGELAWLRAWAEEDLLPTLELAPQHDARGEVIGLAIHGQPGRGTPLVGPRGLRRGDVITRVNGASQRSAQGLAASLRRFLAGGGTALDIELVRSGVVTRVRYRFPRR